MRAFAVLQMVQGHTVDVLLASEYRDIEYPLYALWFFMRGMTAPIFLFTAGTVFTYLFRLVKEPFDKNPRVWKGIKRVGLLVFLGYMLRYPTYTILDFSKVTETQWRIFFSVDVLHLIGVSLLFVIILAWFAEKTKLGDYTIFGFAALVFFILSPTMESISWLNYFHAPVAAYFNKDAGSLFPLFPWAGYVLSGAVLGSYLAKNPMIFKTSIFSIRLGFIGIGFIAIAFLIAYVGTVNFGSVRMWNTSPYLIFLRLGIVLMFNSIVSYISHSVNSVPKFIILVGRNTLLIYIVHLLILYGSAWNPGLNNLYAKSFDTYMTITSALIMIILMTGMVLIINRLKIKNKELVT